MKFLERRPGRSPDEERVVLGTDDGSPAARGLWFHGRPQHNIRPWADLIVTDYSIVAEVVAALEPGSSIMVAYETDETEFALKRKVPPCATPLGLEMLRAGCRWFKDWYYPEGGREGGTKLQASLPLDGERRANAEAELRAELTEFLSRPGIRGADRRRAEAALGVLDAPGGT